jgi:hypothetical protein
MQRQCDVCGKDYDAKRATSQFCGGTCRARARRGREAEAVAAPAATAGSQPTGDRPALHAAVLAELVEVKRESTALGLAALSLAMRIETGMDTGSALASLTRELRATRADALQGAKDTRSGLEGIRDELAARRRA